MEELKAEARARGLWNLFLPESEYGAGPHQPGVRAALRAHGRSRPLVAEATNCSAPDTGNMELLAKFATPLQVEQFLAAPRRRDPLLLRDDRTVGRQLRRHQHPESHHRDGDELRDQRAQVVDERRGVAAMHLRDPDGRLRPRRRPSSPPQHGARAVRHSRRVRRALARRCSATTPAAATARRCSRTSAIPKEYLLGEEGGGFALAQARLGPGRIHHCMRAIGMAEKALRLMCERTQQRVAFGKPIADQGTVQALIAESRHRDRTGPPAHDEGGVADGHRRRQGRALRDRRDQGRRRAPRHDRDRPRHPDLRRRRRVERLAARRHVHPRAHPAPGRRPRRGPPPADRPTRAARLRVASGPA